MQSTLPPHPPTLLSNIMNQSDVRVNLMALARKMALPPPLPQFVKWNILIELNRLNNGGWRRIGGR